MGTNFSITRKATIAKSLLAFTKWRKEEMRELFQRSQFVLSETFALRQTEFEFLLSRDLIDFVSARDIFVNMLDTDKNKLVDKFEVMLLIMLLSSLTNAEKVEYMFELFNFNGKGYLIRSELSLLFYSLTRVVEKADPKMTAPSPSLIEDLIGIAFDHYCKIDPRGIAFRKPELVRFAAEVIHVQTYLDAWRGHAGQVQLPVLEKWRDVYFPCNETSISPSRDWIQQGALPAHFVLWRRKERIGRVDNSGSGVGNDASGNAGGDGRVALFTHKSRGVKSVDKRRCLFGPGVLGNGLLRQGFLADRWILNGLAACISRPKLFEHMFAPTGQEGIGRFCVRLYEGGSWRSVFVDDRIPCAPDHLPLYAQSSDSQEYWPLIFEKAMAKYFGSYGHVGLCSARMDSVTMGLRMLTGGHSLKLATADFEWNSVPADNPARDGLVLVNQLRAEGSIVAFGRSEALAMHDSTLKHSPRKNTPHGLVYPVVLTKLKDDGYKVLVVRDAFGQFVPTADAYTDQGDTASGHSRIREIRVEDLPGMFDTVFVCRFPDATRVGADREGFPQWQTKITQAQTHSPQQPARFLLTVSPAPAKPKPSPKEEVYRLSKMREKAGRVVEMESDVVTQEMQNRFNYDRPRMVPGEAGTAVKVDPSSEEKTGDVAADKPVSVAMTLSSSCNWIVAGSPEAGAKIRLRIVPSMSTLKVLRERRAAERAQEEARRRLAEERQRGQQELLAAKPEEGEEVGEADASITASATQSVAQGSAAAAEAAAAAETTAASEAGSAEEKSAAGGSVEVPAAMPSQAPAPDPASTKPKKLTFADKEALLKEHFFEMRSSANLSWLSQSLNLWPGEYYVSVDVSYAMSKEKRLELTTPVDQSEAPWLDNRHHDVDQVWCQVSSVGACDIKAISAEECPPYAASVASLAVPPEKFAFSFETPAEASSRGVESLLTRLKSDCLLLDAEYLATRLALKKLYRHAKREDFL